MKKISCIFSVEKERAYYMQKTIRIISIAAIALMGLSLILLVASISFQRVIIGEIYGIRGEIFSALPQFPLIPFFYCLLLVACVVLLIISCNDKKGNIGIELFILIALIIILPSINSYASYKYATFIGGLDVNKMTGYSLASRISSYCMIPSKLGTALAYVACGMSIAFKAMSKKQGIEQ